MANMLRVKKKLLMAGLLAGMASLLLIGAITVKSPGDPVLLSVNGQKITAGEFKWHLGLNRALAADYFTQTYGVSYSSDFWTTGFSGEVPLQKLVDEAKKQLMRKQIMQQLAQQAGVVSDIRFDTFQDGMEKENDRRSQAAAGKEVVYGPLHLEARAYYSYYMSNLEDATIEAMRRSGGIAFSEKQLKSEYETNKQRYLLPGAISLEWATLPYGPEPEFKERHEAMEKMRLLQTGVAGGAGFREKAEELGVNIGDAKITTASRRTAALENPLVLLTAEQLVPGQTSALFEENGAVHLLHCMAVDDAGYRSFEQAKDSIALYLAQQKFQSIVEQKLTEAEVEWNPALAMSLADHEVQ